MLSYIFVANNLSLFYMTKICMHCSSGTEVWRQNGRTKLENVFVKHYAPTHMLAPK